MTKAVLEFDLSDPEEKREYDQCLKAKDCLSVLWEFREFLIRDENLNHPERIRDYFYSILEQEQVYLDDLYQ